MFRMVVEDSLRRRLLWAVASVTRVLSALSRNRDARTIPEWQDTLVVIDIPQQSASLDHHLFAECLGESSLLAWVIRRLRAATSDHADFCVLVDAVAEDSAREAIGGEAASLLRRRFGFVHASEMRDALVRREKQRVLLVDTTAALLPPPLFKELWHSHTASRNHATILGQVPCLAFPVLLDGELLSGIASGIPGLPQDVRAAISGFRRASTAMGKPFALRVETAVLVTEAEKDERRWPFLARLDMPDDVETLRRILQLDDGNVHETASLEPLDHWAVVSARDRQVDVPEATSSPRVPTFAEPGPPRILYAQAPSAFTGCEQVLVLLAGRVGSNFEPSALIGLAGTLTDRLASAGVDVHVARRDYSANSVENYLFCRRSLDEIRPAILHAHAFAGVPLCCAAAEHGIPFVQHVHVASEPALMQLRDQLRFAHQVIVVSEFVKRRVMRLDVNADKIHVIRNGAVTGPQVRPADPAAARARVRQAWGVPEDGKVVLLVTRFAPNKRPDVAVEALARLRATIPDAYLLIAGEAFHGDQPMFETVQRRVDALRIREYVRFLGFWREMPELYAAADVLLLPSEADPLPMTIMEAMAAGVPVVAARSGGIPEMVEHGRSGLLAQPGDVDGFAAALREVITQPQLGTTLADAARKRCEDEFSVSRFVDRVSKVYESVLVSAGH